MPINRERLLPLVLTLAVVLLDQATKIAVVATVEPVYLNGHVIEVIGDFLRIIHARNPGVAFSIGRNLPVTVRTVLFTLLPLIVLAGLMWYYLRTDELTRVQRWAIAGIVGGGAGNLIDRIMRPDGVVDFIDVRIYGLFGMQRWPTFNVADAAVVVCGMLLIISVFLEERRRHSE
ncbi:MAG: signal peptidase II [Spirochaetaceae bacterium]|nr:MAG: signal peptidase II [Spirochaetaceae bacterium]